MLAVSEEITFPQIVIRSSDFVLFKFFVSANFSADIVSGNVVVLGITYNITLMMMMKIMMIMMMIIMMMMNLLFSN